MERAWPFLASVLALSLSAASGLASSAASVPPVPAIPRHPERIVALGLPADELALALVSADRIVAVDRFADDPDASNVVEEARAVPRRVGVELEQVLASRPDLVLLPAWTGPELEIGLHRFGVPTLRVEHATSLDGVRSAVRSVARALDAVTEGEQLVAQLDAELEAVRVSVRDRERPTVLLDAGSGFSPAAHTLFADLVEVAGGRLLLAELGDEGLAPVGIERELALDPDVVIVDAYRADARERAVLGSVGFASGRRFAHLRAVRTGRVFPLPARALLTTTHHVGETARELARALHGELP